MMKIPEFLSTIYLGDRFCTGLSINVSDGVVKIGANIISRFKGQFWTYDANEDIEGGWMVFRDVVDLQITPSGCMPNDAFGEFWAEASDEDPQQYQVVFQIVHVEDTDNGNQGSFCDIVELRFKARSMHLEGP